MTEQEAKHYFAIIDVGLKEFITDKCFWIDNVPKGYWIVFNQRSIRCNSNGLSYLLQVFPHFNAKETIVSWTLYGVVSYDTETNRYLAQIIPASEVSLKHIATNIVRLIGDAYNYIISLKKKDIQFAVKLSK